MKKALGLFSVVLLLLVLLPGTGQAQIRFGFKAYGGLAYIGGGDLNKGSTGFSEFNLGILDALGYDTEGEFAPVHLGMNFGGEFIIQFTPTMGVGLGVGYITATKESEIDYTPSDIVEFSWKSSPSAIPITATLYYFLPSSGNMKFFFNLGLGYYLANANFQNNWWLLLPINWDVKTTGGGLGFHGGVGLEYAFTPMFGLFAEFKGRYAAFSNFEGSVDWSFPGWGGDFTEEGTLWAFEDDFGGSVGTQTWLWLSESEPAGTDVREAKIDFSGFSFLIGIIVHF